MTTIILKDTDLPLLEDPGTKEQFVNGIINILKGEPIPEDNTLLTGVLKLMANNLRTPAIKGIPKYNPAGVSDKIKSRYDNVQRGMVPVDGLNHGYSALRFLSITGQDRKYLNELYLECRSRAADADRYDSEYRKFVGYIAAVLEWFSCNIDF